MDNEIKGLGNQYDYGFRIYSPRIAKFLSVDPLAAKYPKYSSYIYAGNMPIWAIDKNGLEPVFANDGSGRIIGYLVEPGQGPSQIAADLNNNYSGYLTERIEWTDIVDWNYANFKQNGGYSNMNDINDNGYRDLNINPNDFLDICAASACIQDSQTTQKNSISQQQRTSSSPKKIQDAYYLQLSGSFIVGGGGASLSVGYVQDSYGDSSFYTTVGGGLGLETGLSGEGGIIQEENGIPFVVDNWEGHGFAAGIDLSILGSISRGGNYNSPRSKKDFRLAGDTYTTIGGIPNIDGIKGLIAKGISKVKLKVGGSYQWTTTSNKQLPGQKK